MSNDGADVYCRCCCVVFYPWRLTVNPWPFPAYPNPKDPGPHRGKPVPFNPDNEEDAPL